MPTYDYECEICGEIREVFHKINDPGPTCHDKPMKRLISGGAIRKGGGIFSIDFIGEKTKKLGDWKE